jgi:GNAT superfamily N-acetyltransferase
MDTSNMGLVSRQLIRTELAGDVEETTGGCLVWGDTLWVGLWDLTAIEDPEKFILSVQEQAKARDTNWRGVVLLLSPGEESSPSFVEFSEALFVYGLEKRAGLGSGAPDMVQVLGKPAKAILPSGLEIVTPKGLDAVRELISQATIEDDSLAASWYVKQSQWLDGCTALAALLDGQPVGVLLVRESDLASRAVLLWVAPDNRNQGIGAALVAQNTALAEAKGRMLSTAWTYRTGKLRYYFGKLGFQEQLCAQYFLSEEAGD